MRGAVGSRAIVWFDFNNLGLALGIALKLAISPSQTSVRKRLKAKVGQFWWLISTFVEVTGEKLIGCLSPPHLQS